jgi:hypothetical protein
MSSARKSLLTLAAVLMTFAYVAPSFAELVITGIDGESKKDPPPSHIEIVAAPAATVCIYVLGTAICVSK